MVTRRPFRSGEEGKGEGAEGGRGEERGRGGGGRGEEQIVTLTGVKVPAWEQKK